MARAFGLFSERNDSGHEPINWLITVASILSLLTLESIELEQSLRETDAQWNNNSNNNKKDPVTFNCFYLIIIDYRY